MDKRCATCGDPAELHTHVLRIATSTTPRLSIKVCQGCLDLLTTPIPREVYFAEMAKHVRFLIERAPRTLSWDEIADGLNEMGCMTMTALKFTPATAYKLLDQLKIDRTNSTELKSHVPLPMSEIPVAPPVPMGDTWDPV